MGAPVRIGDTVRRLQGPNSSFVRDVRGHFQRAGVTWAPRPLGVDELERDVLSWIPDDTPTSGSEVNLESLVGIVQQLHDLTAALVDEFECVVHDDLQPRNVVVRNRSAVGLIDWEQARPGRRVEDIAKLCWSFVEPRPGQDPADIGSRWRGLLAAYPLHGSHELLLPMVLAQLQRCADDIQREAAGHSARHQALAARGDDADLRAMHSWVRANEGALQKAIEG